MHEINWAATRIQSYQDFATATTATMTVLQSYLPLAHQRKPPLLTNCLIGQYGYI